jgi:hypothetical protein
MCSSTPTGKNASVYGSFISTINKPTHFGIGLCAREWINVMPVRRHLIYNYIKGSGDKVTYIILRSYRTIMMFMVWLNVLTAKCALQVENTVGPRGVLKL